MKVGRRACVEMLKTHFAVNFFFLQIGKVMGSIRRNRDNMKCFNESDVIFAVNKWDAVQSRRKKENPWQDVVDKITKSWPQVNLDNIIKMSAIQVKYSF